MKARIEVIGDFEDLKKVKGVLDIYGAGAPISDSAKRPKCS
jgi:hypothetical protein